MNKYNTLKVLFLILFGMCAYPVMAAPLTLVKDSKPNATIVFRSSTNPKAQPIVNAAKDLQLYIQKMTGVTLPLETGGKDVPGITLNVGRVDTSIDSDLPDKILNPETYKITQRGDNVYFEGNYPSPTAFAVYSFLQDQFGIRWFAPGEDWEYIPNHREKSTFTIDIRDVISIPDTSPRIWSDYPGPQSWKDWRLRNKAVQSEKVPKRNFQNFMYRIFPPSKYAKSHPEYFPLINGKRWIPKDDNDRHWWPDIDNPEVKRITIQFIRDYFDKYPDLDSFSLGMDDIWTRNSNFTPKKYYDFVNDIAREIERTHPDRYIGVLIYSFLSEPAADIPKMEDNVFGYLARGASAWWFLPDKKEEWMRIASGWRERVSHLSRYEYIGSGSFVPSFFPHTLAEAFQFDKSLGFEGMYAEVYSFPPHTAPMLWAFAQMQWNSKQNIDELLYDFYTKMYPSTYQSMKQYYDLLEKSWNTPRPGHTTLHRNIVGQATSISSEAVNEGIKILDTAYNQAQTSIEKRRIDVVRGGLKFASYAVLEYALGQELSVFPITNERQAKSGLTVAKKFVALVRDREMSWKHASEREDLLGESIRASQTPSWSGAEASLQSNFGPIESPGVTGILRIMDWYSENKTGEMQQIKEELIKGLPDGFVKNTIEASAWMSSMKSNGIKSLLKNGNLEDNSPSNNTEQQFDWETIGAPTEWYTWSSGGTGEFSFVEGRNKSKGFHVNGIAAGKKPTNSILLQTIPVESGRRYLGVVWVKLDNPSYAVGTALTLRFRDKKGWYKGEGSSQSATAIPINDWQKIIIVAVVPEGATSVSYQLGANKAAVIFDDAAFYKLPE